jgi:phenylalanyl-tRNA synthetase beta chain
MKLPLKSIEEYTGLSLELEDIKNTISTRIGEIEGIQNWGDAYKGIYVAQITKKMDHPDADKLGIYKISIGDENSIQVVAGDKTLEVGDRVAYIQPGNIVSSTYGTSEEFVIKPVKMRGVLSDGMLCSEKELNLGTDHTKVMRVSNDAVIGQSFAMYFNLDDTVIDIENKALTNRGDLFGILGLAREISAAKGLTFNSPEWYKNGIRVKESDDILLTIENNASSICPRYIGVVMDNIEISESPIWLKSILIKSGIRPINNVVDITNYMSI